MNEYKRICKDCEIEFIVTIKEQEQLRARYGKDYKPPTRCKACRRKRRKEGRKENGNKKPN